MHSNEFPVGETADTFRYPAPSWASRGYGTRCPFAVRKTLAYRDRVLECESGMEGNAVHAFLGRTDVIDIWEQPPHLTFVDDDGKKRKHVVDLLVTYEDRSRDAVLVKARGRIEATRLRRIRDLLAAQAPRGFADHYVIVSEDKLPRHLLANGRIFADVRMHGPHTGHPHVETMRGIVTGPMTVSEAMSRAGLGGDGFRALLRCAVDRSVRLVDQVRFDLPAMIEPVTSNQGDLS